ncbi:unnamed protein product [Acanthoscelides obtectus]|uniref:Uncharacterized protein n=1 Tax=Acanthoscelides obtectus TaxID=200917 RepID=A0A9P0L445_ACAOB|nr:unnamed protein product [Acanthoscelides obtectus]CAK1646017.1 hypothetical protein AOBTE_LOCUS14399 [Acanthoscelides obtectus]
MNMDDTITCSESLLSNHQKDTENHVEDTEDDYSESGTCINSILSETSTVASSSKSNFKMINEKERIGELKRKMMLLLSKYDHMSDEIEAMNETIKCIRLRNSILLKRIQKSDDETLNAQHTQLVQ